MADRQLLIRNGCDRITEYPVAASQTIAVGQPVAVDGDGRVIIATAASTALLGICAKDVTASAADDLCYVYDDPDVVFEIVADNSAEVLQTVVGETHDLIVTTDVFYANLGATTTNVIRVKAIKPFYQPLADDVAFEGSTLVGDLTPGWKTGGSVLCEFAAHVLKS
jgi:hypothetical protein